MYDARDDHSALRIDPSLYIDMPFFHARRADDGITTTGDPIKILGCKVPGPEGNGVFTEWQWDGGALTLRNDRLGMYPVFYYSTDDAVVVSTSIFKILSEGVRPEIDWPALGVFLRTGAFMGTDTAFVGIKALPANATLVWRPGKLDVTGSYWFVPRREPTRPAAVDEYIDAFRQAILRRLPQGSFAMPLSGGRDSRHILFALAEAGRRPDFVVTGRRFPPERTVDERVASEVAAAVGVPHGVVGPPKFEVPSYLAANVITNMTAPRRGWKLSVARKLRESVQTSYDGIGGDMLSGGSALSPTGIKLIESGKLADFCRSCFTNRMVDKMVPKSQVSRMSEDIVVQHMLPELERHLAAANPATSFFFWNRTRRFDSSNPYGMLSQIPIVHSPFLDLELFECLSALPVEFNLRGWLHDEVIKKAYPQYAHILFEPPDPMIGTDVRRVRRTTWDLIRYLSVERPTYLFRPEFYLPRLTARALPLGYGHGRLQVDLLVYLTQLESILKNGLPNTGPRGA